MVLGIVVSSEGIWCPSDPWEGPGDEQRRLNRCAKDSCQAQDERDHKEALRLPTGLRPSHVFKKTGLAARQDLLALVSWNFIPQLAKHKFPWLFYLGCVGEQDQRCLLTNLDSRVVCLPRQAGVTKACKNIEEIMKVGGQQHGKVVM